MRRSGTDPIPLKKWFAELRLVPAVAIAYLAAAWLGLALLAKSENLIAVYWPAAGLAAGVLIVLGPASRLPVAAGVAAATVAAHLMANRNVWEAPAFAVCNAGEVLLVAWLIERWFGRRFRLEDIPQVTGLFLAAVIGAGLAAAGATATLELFGQTTAPPLTIWLLLFASDALGIVTLAPVLIGLASASRRALPTRELVEGSIALMAMAVTGTLVFALPPGLWATVVPAASLFPFVLWVAARCRPVFAAAAAFVIAAVIVGTMAYGVGRFGDPSVPLAARVLAAQTGVLAGALSTLFLAAVFATLRESEARLRSILNAANVVAWEVDLMRDTVHATGPTARFFNSQPGLQPVNIWASADAVHPADRERVRAEFAAALRGKTPFRVEFRIPLPAGSVRWLASEGTVVRDKDGRPLRVLGVNHDVTDRKSAAEALRESEERMRLAAQAANIGFWVLDLATQRVHGTPEYFALLGLPPSDEPVALAGIQALYLPEDRTRIISTVEESIRTGRLRADDRHLGPAAGFSVANG